MQRKTISSSETKSSNNAPLLANSLAASFPIPDEAPVITTVRPGILSLPTYFFPPITSLQTKD